MPNRQPTSRTCFVCGRENPVGLKVKWDQHPEAGARGTVLLARPPAEIADRWEAERRHWRVD